MKTVRKRQGAEEDRHLGEELKEDWERLVGRSVARYDPLRQREEREAHEREKEIVWSRICAVLKRRAEQMLGTSSRPRYPRTESVAFMGDEALHRLKDAMDKMAEALLDGDRRRVDNPIEVQAGTAETAAREWRRSRALFLNYLAPS